MSSDNIIEFDKKLREMKAAQVLGDDLYTEVPKPTLLEIASFVTVLCYIRQLSPDGSGKIVFDDFNARIVLDGNRINSDDDTPRVNTGLVIEGIFPLMWDTFLAAQLENDEEDVSLEEIILIAQDIITQLEPDVE